MTSKRKLKRELSAWRDAWDWKQMAIGYADRLRKAEAERDELLKERGDYLEFISPPQPTREDDDRLEARLNWWYSLSYRTPQRVIDAIQVIDPACGTGGLIENPPFTAQ